MDDEEALRKLVTMIVGNLGYEVHDRGGRGGSDRAV